MASSFLVNSSIHSHTKKEKKEIKKEKRLVVFKKK